MPSYEKIFEIEATDIDGTDRNITVRALEKVSLYQMIEAVYDFIADNRNFEYSAHTEQLEFISSTGTSYKFRQNAYWINSGTILSDISRQLKI